MTHIKRWIAFEGVDGRVEVPEFTPERQAEQIGREARWRMLGMSEGDIALNRRLRIWAESHGEEVPAGLVWLCDELQPAVPSR